jgi:GT2 family glycosyltransferase
MNARAPVRLLEWELAAPRGAVVLGEADAGRPYAGVLCLVRLHGVPLGFVPLAGDATAAELADAVWGQLADAITAHLERDGIERPTALPPGGLPPGTACARERAAIRDGAPPATVVVATHERPHSLERCLRSLLELDYPGFEVIVVDNAPVTGATRDLLASGRFGSGVRCVTEPLQGLAAAHNRGLAEAAGAFVAFTDDDVVVDRLWLLELARGFRLADGVVCVTGLIAPAELQTPAQLLAERTWGWGKGFEPRVFDLATDTGDPLYPYTAGRFGSGANMAFDTRALRELGGFDPATGAGTIARGGDDLAAFFNVIASGARLVYNPAAIVHHAHHAEHSALRRQAYAYGVGLTAYLTSTLVARPERLLDFTRRAHHGLARARDPRGSDRTTVDATDLKWAERLGMLYGPAAYLRSRRRVRRRAMTGTDAVPSRT